MTENENSNKTAGILPAVFTELINGDFKNAPSFDQLYSHIRKMKEANEIFINLCETAQIRRVYFMIPTMEAIYKDLRRDFEIQKVLKLKPTNAELARISHTLGKKMYNNKTQMFETKE